MDATFCFSTNLSLMHYRCVSFKTATANELLRLPQDRWQRQDGSLLLRQRGRQRRHFVPSLHQAQESGHIECCSQAYHSAKQIESQHGSGSGSGRIGRGGNEPSVGAVDDDWRPQPRRSHELPQVARRRRGSGQPHGCLGCLPQRGRSPPRAECPGPTPTCPCIGRYFDAFQRTYSWYGRNPGYQSSHTTPGDTKQATRGRFGRRHPHVGSRTYQAPRERAGQHPRERPPCSRLWQLRRCIVAPSTSGRVWSNWRGSPPRHRWPCSKRYRPDRLRVEPTSADQPADLHVQQSVFGFVDLDLPCFDRAGVFHTWRPSGNDSAGLGSRGLSFRGGKREPRHPICLERDAPTVGHRSPGRGRAFRRPRRLHTSARAAVDPRRRQRGHGWPHAGRPSLRRLRRRRSASLCALKGRSPLPA
ncbi:hypothetical protein ACHAWF_002736 [Thalassiosira exigua]